MDPRNYTENILGLPSEANSFLVCRESGIIPVHLLIKMETAECQPRSVSEYVQIVNIFEKHIYKTIPQSMKTCPGQSRNITLSHPLHHGKKIRARTNSSSLPLGYK